MLSGHMIHQMVHHQRLVTLIVTLELLTFTPVHMARFKSVEVFLATLHV